MSRPSAPRRAWFVLVLALGTTGIVLVPAGAKAALRSQHEPAAEPESEESGGWGPIVGACFGVLFGGSIALWQIRGMKKRE
ncbi:MAG: hypothetical protein K0V04_27905 [Deltaproteobacteria bacterium]|nr:hypothetical protein [Deltaproteobacteria bacterium]